MNYKYFVKVREYTSRHNEKMEIAEVKPIIVSQDLSQCMSGGTWAYSNRTVCLVKIITRYLCI